MKLNDQVFLLQIFRPNQYRRPLDRKSILSPSNWKNILSSLQILVLVLKERTPPWRRNQRLPAPQAFPSSPSGHRQLLTPATRARIRRRPRRSAPRMRPPWTPWARCSRRGEMKRCWVMVGEQIQVPLRTCSLVVGSTRKHPVVTWVFSMPDVALRSGSHVSSSLSTWVRPRCLSSVLRPAWKAPAAMSTRRIAERRWRAERTWPVCRKMHLGARALEVHGGSELKEPDCSTIPGTPGPEGP